VNLQLWSLFTCHEESANPDGDRFSHDDREREQVGYEGRTAYRPSLDVGRVSASIGRVARR
jgi:hypothetical protein